MTDHDFNPPSDTDAEITAESAATENQPETVQQSVPATGPTSNPAASQPAESSEGTKPPVPPAQIGRPLPAQQLVLPIVPIREGVLFPSTESVLTFGRPISTRAINAASKGQNLVVLVTQKKAEHQEPKPTDLFTIGTLASVERTLSGDDQLNALVRGIGRVKILRYVKTEPYLVAQVIKLEDQNERSDEQRALAVHLQKEFRRAIHMGKPVEFLNFMKLMSGVTDGELVDQIASTLTIKTLEKQLLLETLSVTGRLRKVTEHLAHEMKVLEIEKDVTHKTQAKFDKHMRESVLRERLRTIQKELGELDEDEEVLAEYELKLKKAKLTGDVRDKVIKEIKRLKQMSVNNPEAGYVRTWLDTVFELPWHSYSKDRVDLKQASDILNANHHALKDVKDRILEYIAVMQLKQRGGSSAGESSQTSKGSGKPKKDRHVPTILCFVGPPGVGKTSIGKSIAEALGRKFTKVSLGGVRDEAEIRGHRRTYVGAMPGRIIAGLKQAKTKNPVFMLDEIDKLGSDFRGDPSSALLETLDPEQNSTFEDHYLDMPFDLSQVIFITTANTLDTIPAALRDRLEIIRYSGYTQEEKFQIAKNYLIKKTLKANGLKATQFALPDELLRVIIERYTREAGVRGLEKVLSKIMRKAARDIVTTGKKISLTTAKLKTYLGPEPFDVTLTEQQDEVGLATGLAWTSVGGDVLFIEVALTPGKGLVKLTGQLGDVMKESAQAAFTYVKAHATELGIEPEKLNTIDVHVHIPEGAVPKDGPSAGITLTTAIISAFTNRPVRREIAMTGEVTLRGRVLRIGGLKEKSIAAHRAGSKIVIIPKDNARDLVDIPDSVKAEVTFKPVATIDEVLAIALQPLARSATKKTRQPKHASQK